MHSIGKADISCHIACMLVKWSAVCTFPLCALHGFVKKYGICRSSVSHISSWIICWLLREDFITFEFFIFFVDCGYTLRELEELWNIIPCPKRWEKLLYDSLTKCDFIFCQCSSYAHKSAVLYAAQFCKYVEVVCPYCGCWSQKIYFCNVFFL